MKAVKSKTKLPDWATEPLKFGIAPDEALRRCAYRKPKKGWAKTIITGRRASR